MRIRIYKRGPTWWADWWEKGQRVRQSTGCRDRAAAEAWRAAKEFREVKRAAGLPSPEPCSLATAVAEFLTESKAHWSLEWYRLSFRVLKDGIHRWGPDTLLTDLSAFQFQEWRTSMDRSSPSTINRYTAVWRRFCSWAVENGKILGNPASNLQTFREKSRRVPDVTPTQREALIFGMPQKYHTLMLFALDTGWREGEIGRLRWGEINLNTGTATMYITKNREPKQAFLTERLIEALLQLNRRMDGYVFGPVPDFRKLLKKARIKAGIEGHISFHSLRHIWATHLMEAGATIPEAMWLGGWKKAPQILTYAHARQQRLQALMDRFAGHTTGTSPHDETK